MEVHISAKYAKKWCLDHFSAVKISAHFELQEVL
jgi:hypothetical protein